eukprot:TRINITY_DN4955_c0_g3_i3.p1 TRINITY_DN4955_c0_g3~~TRINITY_DN4955_c0_g3_i3.p1  ORF type:complete len:128 (+),score=15.26 TRINITY_DN4955_c0_g3_i3:69-452(+)
MADELIRSESFEISSLDHLIQTITQALGFEVDMRNEAHVQFRKHGVTPCSIYVEPVVSQRPSPAGSYVVLCPLYSQSPSEGHELLLNVYYYSGMLPSLASTYTFQVPLSQEVNQLRIQHLSTNQIRY